MYYDDANIGYFKKFDRNYSISFVISVRAYFWQRHIASQYGFIKKYSNYASCVPTSYSNATVVVIKPYFKHDVSKMLDSTKIHTCGLACDRPSTISLLSN